MHTPRALHSIDTPIIKNRAAEFTGGIISRRETCLFCAGQPFVILAYTITENWVELANPLLLLLHHCIVALSVDRSWNY